MRSHVRYVAQDGEQPRVRYHEEVQDQQLADAQHRRPWMPPPTVTNTNDFNFVNCTTPGCAVTPAFSEYNAMTLRAGYEPCMMHTDVSTIKSRAGNTQLGPNATSIFYDLEVNSSNKVDQLSALPEAGDHFDMVVKTTTRPLVKSEFANKFVAAVKYALALATSAAMLFVRHGRGGGVPGEQLLVPIG